MDRQCSSCGGFCKKSGCERENVKPAPQRKPLTDEEIKRMAAKWFLSMYWPLCNTFAREIEAAHGIKEKNQ